MDSGPASLRDTGKPVTLWSDFRLVGVQGDGDRPYALREGKGYVKIQQQAVW